MPEPYYQDGFVTIYNGDSRHVLEQLPEMGLIVVVTDPPYGATARSQLSAAPRRCSTLPRKEEFARGTCAMRLRGFRLPLSTDAARISGKALATVTPSRNEPHVIGSPSDGQLRWGANDG